MIVNILTAAMINRQMGGMMITPWEIDELDDVTVDYFFGLARDLGEMKKGLQAVEAVKQTWRNSHPTYRK